MRGEGARPARHQSGGRITPAHAGRRGEPGVWRAARWDHPRACGEKCTRVFSFFAVLGSPPRMRGKETYQREPLATQRITPAHAGKRNHAFLERGCRKDHPRACGEKEATGHAYTGIDGSPPRMRGKEMGSPPAAPDPRITPAHAGKSLDISASHGLKRDHPRACGEKAQQRERLFCDVGSPPRMRGKVTDEQVQGFDRRITPAHAGKSPRGFNQRAIVWDHPRACGEKRVCIRENRYSRGSPPRMRGKGKTTRCRRQKPLDHPRACGEKTKKIPYHRLFPLRSAPFSFSFA